jgi:hypothetical protein
MGEVGNVGPDGLCDYHRRYGSHHKCIPPRRFETRRGMYERKPRYPEYGGYYTTPPPVSIKKIWNRRLRQIAKREVSRYGEVMTDLRKLQAGWYQYWD